MARKVYTARNGARYIKLANGQCRFISGASRQYLNKIRKMRGGGCGGDHDQRGGALRNYRIHVTAGWNPDITHEEHDEIIGHFRDEIQPTARESGLPSFTLRHARVNMRGDRRHHSMVISFSLDHSEEGALNNFIEEYVLGELGYEWTPPPPPPGGYRPGEGSVYVGDNKYIKADWHAGDRDVFEKINYPGHGDILFNRVTGDALPANATNVDRLEAAGKTVVTYVPTLEWSPDGW